jgi:dolichol kinase
MLFLPTSSILLGYAIATFLYLMHHRKEKVKKKLFSNELALVLLFFVSGVLYPFMFQYHSSSISLNTLNILWAISSSLFIIEMIVWAVVLIYNAVISKKYPEIMAQRDYMEYKKKVYERWDDSVKSEFGRKILHLFTCSIIFILWTLGTILENNGILSHFGLNNYSFSHWLIVTIGFAFIFMFQIADLTRLNRYYMLPNWARKWYLSMRPEETETFIASTPLVLSFVPFIFTPFPIFAAVALISTGADAIACIIGKKYGAHKLRKNSKKTIEGFLAGGFTTFVIVIAIMNIYYYLMPIPIVKIYLMAILSTGIFLLIDYISLRISDNILNPLLIGFIMWIIYII